MPKAEQQLIRILRAAHAGERAASLAYYGHAHSVKNLEERDTITRIGREETDHRATVGEMLASLGSQPSAVREWIFACIGHTLSTLCYMSGWFFPMYGAGWIERRNIQEYVDAAQLANATGHYEFAQTLMSMAQVEWDHEQYFRSKVQQHWLRHIIPLWSMPANRNELLQNAPINTPVL